MSSEEAVRLKNEGSAAYSRGDFAAASALFTGAIEKLSPETDKEALKLLYSNRSASYHSLKEYEKALEDGNKCVSLDCNWPKGYGRKGDALLALKRFGEAYNAYNAGLRISPADQALADKAERAMRGIRSESQASPSSSATPSWIVYMRYLVLGCILLYCVPFGGFAVLFGRVGAAAFAVDHIASVIQRHGRPRFENDYAVRVLPDPSTPSLLLGIFVAVSPRLYFMALVPIFLLTVMTFLAAILSYGRQHSRDIEEKTFPLIRRFVPSAAPVLQSLNVAALLSDRQIPQVSLLLQKLAAQAQVSQGIFLVIELLLPSRNFIQLYLWWQFLKMQYMQEQAFSGSSRPKLIQEAFVDIDKQINGLLSNRLVPQLLRTGYNTLKTYLAKQVELPTNSPAAESRGGGLLSKCTIM